MDDIKTAGGERDSARSEPHLEHERLESATTTVLQQAELLSDAWTEAT